jgi:hypothetical protein
MSDETTPAVSQPPPSTPPTQTINIQPAVAQPSNGMAVAAMVLGIVGLLIFWIPIVGWICPIVGLILGLVALQRPYGKGMAIAGVACSAVALLIKVVFWVLVITAVGAAASHG